jgi:hypothetical protein
VTSGELDSGTCRRELQSQIDIVVSIADPDHDCKTAGDGLATIGSCTNSPSSTHSVSTNRRRLAASTRAEPE